MTSPVRPASREAHKAIALIALACLAIGILWSLQATTGITRYDQVITTDPWGETATYTYAPLRADGSGSLTMGEPGYFTHDAPTTLIGFAWRLDDDTAERVTALGTMKLLVKHEASQGRAAWSFTETLAEGTLSGTASEALSLEGLVDFKAVTQRIEATAGREIEGSTWSVLSQVRFASVPTADHAADATAYELPISYTAPLYVFPDAHALTSTKDHTQRETVHHEQVGGLPALAAKPLGPTLLLAGIAGLAGTLPRLARDEEVTT